ncbi:lysophospholipid acyltransferase family protein [Modicisalibacter xianhensis]|uniref:1-acyl-sn-glycerol-3-phosphate acyltransferase n=1 Tax=Modicisalibacter xianhensis TaxID=442341 RepID=A0A1I3AMI5_9GAMM|nr:lysophospholipid acyltransferase family protein [Halomonas xianhensis]SFH51225.1 1-acyl-sn-glycerol-3-phosphate acyltransferase [Halomonas xianhensis]
MSRLLRWLFFALFVRPLVLVILGLNVRHRERLPKHGPAVLTANHNSHLDTLVLISLMPLGQLHRIRPVAAMDYFMRNRALAWFSTQIIGILPIARQRRAPDEDPLAGCSAALAQGDILIFFPEGSRGEPERLAEFRGGVARLAARHPEVPFVPIFMHGLGKALPRGEALLVPFFLDVFIGESLCGREHVDNFLPCLRRSIEALRGEGRFASWE